MTLCKKINVAFIGEAIYGNFDWEKVTNYDRSKDVTFWKVGGKSGQLRTFYYINGIQGNFTLMENKKAKFVIC